MPRLLWRGLHMTLLRELPLHRSRLSPYAARAAVIAHAVSPVVIHNHRLVDIYIGDAGAVHIHHSAVVVEPAAAPFATTKPFAAITEAVIYTAIEADVRTPIAGIPPVVSIGPTPVTGRP